MFRRPPLSLIVLSIFLFVLAFTSFASNGPKKIGRAQAVRSHVRKDVPMKGFGARPPVTVDQIQYDSGLYKRDVCNDAFPGRYSEICEPSQTLCCIIPDEDRPACMNILGFGFCCTEHTDCFVDTDSACDDTGSQECATDICCPAQTSCVENFNYTTDTLVRCNVNRALIPGYTASASSSEETSTPTTEASTESPSGTETTSTTNGPTSAFPPAVTIDPNNQEGQENNDNGGGGGGGSSGLSGGATAGIVAGIVGGLALIGLIGWLLWRRHRKNNPAANGGGAPSAATVAYDPVSQYPPGPYAHEMPANHQTELYEAPGGGGGNHAGYYQPKERYAQDATPGHQERHELA